jgi:hypothetical protein
MQNEDFLQQEIFMWFNNNYCLEHHKPRYTIFSVPNGGTRNIKEAMKLKATGLKAGVSDLIVVMNKIIFVEVKTEIGTQSKKQKDFEKIVTNLGYEYWIVKSLKEFQSCISKTSTYQ